MTARPRIRMNALSLSLTVAVACVLGAASALIDTRTVAPAASDARLAADVAPPSPVPCLRVPVTVVAPGPGNDDGPAGMLPTGPCLVVEPQAPRAPEFRSPPSA